MSISLRIVGFSHRRDNATPFFCFSNFRFFILILVKCLTRTLLLRTSIPANYPYNSVAHLPQFNFAKDVSTQVDDAKATMAHYDFLDGFTSAKRSETNASLSMLLKPT